MDDTFLMCTMMVVMMVLYHHTSAGCKCENIVFVTGRIAQSGKLPVLFLLSSQKSTFCPLAENYELDRKMDDNFYDGHDELYRYAKFGEDRTTRAGCRCGNVVFVFFCFFYRQDAAKWQPVGIVFTQ